MRVLLSLLLRVRCCRWVVVVADEEGEEEEERREGREGREELVRRTDDLESFHQNRFRFNLQSRIR